MNIKVNKMTVLTNEISIKNNNLNDGNFQIKPQIQRKIGKLDRENGYILEISVIIKDEPENRFPVNLTAKMSGIFEIEGEQQHAENFLKTRGVELVYPYLRTLIASTSASCMLPPINLPLALPTTLQEK